MLSDKVTAFSLSKKDTKKIVDTGIADAASQLDTAAIDSINIKKPLFSVPKPNAPAPSSPNNPSNPSASPSPVVVGVPSVLEKPALAIFKLLGPCSNAKKSDVRAGVRSDGKGGDGICCDCGEGGVPVVGGGYILRKTVEAIKKTQRAGLGRYVEGFTNGTLDKGQALKGVVDSLNKGVPIGNNELIPTAASLPFGEQAIQVSLDLATKDGRTDWIKDSVNTIGLESASPFIKKQAGSLATNLIKRNDQDGIDVMNGIDTDWTKWVEAGSVHLDGELPSKLSDEQQYDLLLAGSVTNEVSVTA